MFVKHTTAWLVVTLAAAGLGIWARHAPAEVLPGITFDGPIAGYTDTNYSSVVRETPESGPGTQVGFLYTPPSTLAVTIYTLDV